MADSLRKSTFKGIVWSSIDRLSGQIVGFVVIVLMSRVLTQGDYGLVGMIVIFTDLAQTITDSGVTQALIRKQDRNQTDCSTAFYFNLGLGIVLYVILYFISPLISKFYNQPELVPITRVISLSVIINALMMVQKALFTVRIDFKTQTKASLTAAIISGGIGIWMAYTGWRVWAIVYYQLINLIINGILLWFFSSWRPSLTFSKESFKYFFRFGSNLTIAGIMHAIYKDIYLAAIGKFYQASALGYYTRAHQFGALPSFNVSNILQRVTYPILCKFQDDQERLHDSFSKFLRLSSYGIFPMMIGLSMVGKPLVVLLLGESWEYSGVLLSILCLSMMWMPMDTLNLSLLQVRGRTDYFLRCEIVKKVVGIAILIASLPLGLVIVCWGQVLRALLDLIIDSYYTGKYMGYGFISQIKAILPSLICCGFMAFIMWILMGVFQENWLKLSTGILSGVIVYFFTSFLVAPREIKEVRVLINKEKNID